MPYITPLIFCIYIIFITIAANKLPEKLRKKAINIGLVLAMVLRIILLFGISYLTALSAPFWHLNLSWIQGGISGQALILFAGGLFLLYKSINIILTSTSKYNTYFIIAFLKSG